MSSLDYSVLLNETELAKFLNLCIGVVIYTEDGELANETLWTLANLFTLDDQVVESFLY